MAKGAIEDLIHEDVRYLHRLGYAQELFRAIGGFSNFAISFSIISVLTGAVILYGYGLEYGGPGVNGYGWPLVSLFTLLVAAAMAEIASAYPTAGGLYYWACKLRSSDWGWWTAWFNLAGQVTIVAGIDYAAAAFFDQVVLQPLGVPVTLGLQVATTGIILAVQAGLNIAGLHVVAFLNDLSVWVHVIGACAIALALFAFGKYVHPWSYAFIIHPAGAGVSAAYPLAVAFILGLLQAQWTYTGYDASAHVAEETISARAASAWGVFLSVAVSAIVGYILLLAFTLHLPDIGKTLAANSRGIPAVYYILIQNLSTLGFALSLMITIAMLLCGTSSVAAAGRMLFAFARDGGMPGSRWLRRVNRRFRLPANAIVAICAAAFLITAWAQVEAVITALSTVVLYWAYGIPVLLGLVAPSSWREAVTWNLRGWSRPVALVAVLWIVFISILFVWPTPDNPYTLNAMIVFVLFLLVYYAGWARQGFTGPRAGTEAELLRIEAAYTVPGRPTPGPSSGHRATIPAGGPN